MAYTPINWQTGDTITAEKLNKMDNGWSVESTQLFSETVTTVDSEGFNDGTLAYASLIDAGTITVTFDGTEYTCGNINDPSDPNFFGYLYGAPFSEEASSYDFTTYPFSLFSTDGNNRLTTQTAGEHTVAVSTSTLQTSADFAAAVSMASPIDASLLPFRCVPDATTYAEMKAAAGAGRMLYFYTTHGAFHLVISFRNESSDTAVTAYPEGLAGAETYGFDSNMVFAVFVS